jgi:hypothetical protein
MNRQNHSIVFWGCLVGLMLGTLSGLANRYLSGKVISPLDGLVAGTGGVFLLFLHAEIEALEDADETQG